ncbi:MAG: hypothetical protein IPG71_00935 [bacterium]|nr:hypothetical protein [bacterium]
MARRATFVRNSKADSVATVTVEAGNFATLATDAEYNQRSNILLSFYRDEHYDAVALGQQELNSPLAYWQGNADKGLPIVCANLFLGERSKTPVFEPYRWYERAGLRMAVVGLVMPRSLQGCPDSASVRVDSPFKMQKFFKKLMKRTDHLTLIGDFNAAEADSLVQLYPFVNLIVTSNGAVTATRTLGNTVISSCGAKGYFGDYVQMELPESKSDSVKFNSVRATLDVKIPADTFYENRVKDSGIKPRK